MVEEDGQPASGRVKNRKPAQSDEKRWLVGRKRACGEGPVLRGLPPISKFPPEPGLARSGHSGLGRAFSGLITASLLVGNIDVPSTAAEVSLRFH